MKKLIIILSAMILLCKASKHKHKTRSKFHLLQARKLFLTIRNLCLKEKLECPQVNFEFLKSIRNPLTQETDFDTFCTINNHTDCLNFKNTIDIIDKNFF